MRAMQASGSESEDELVKQIASLKEKLAETKSKHKVMKEMLVIPYVIQPTKYVYYRHRSRNCQPEIVKYELI